MDYSRCKIRLFNKTQAKQISWILTAIVALEFLFFPMPILASQGDETDSKPTSSLSLSFSLETNNIIPRDLVGERWSLRMPEEEIGIEEIKNDEFSGRVVRTSKHVMTAYNSNVSQCDASPCITANGFNVCKHGGEDTVAANVLPLGTKIRIPELFGDRVFVVRDRMAKKHANRVDIWMKEYQSAKKFGVKYATIEVIQ
ncbi:MAG TPA: hypothetical protein PKN62_00085 [bacterium]|nr:hypothetical protein [bacterium]